MCLVMREQAPTAAEIEALAREVLQRMPAPFAAHLADIVLVVEEFADEETLAELEIEDPFGLTGVYHGQPVGDKGSTQSGAMPDRIHLYRRPILDEWCDTGDTLTALITHVVVHEVGHHFGLSDEDMHALEHRA